MVCNNSVSLHSGAGDKFVPQMCCQFLWDNFHDLYIVFGFVNAVEKPDTTTQKNRGNMNKKFINQPRIKILLNSVGATLDSYILAFSRLFCLG